MSYSAPTPLQSGVAAALDADDGLEATAPLFRENFRLLADALREGTSVRQVYGCASSPTQGGQYGGGVQ